MAYINKDALKIQQEFAPKLKDYIEPAVELAEATVAEMTSLRHIEKDDGRTMSHGAHEYWRTYFWYKTSTGDKIGTGFGYDLRQWRDDEPNSTVPPWRIYLYLFHPPKVSARA